MTRFRRIRRWPRACSDRRSCSRACSRRCRRHRRDSGRRSKSTSSPRTARADDGGAARCDGAREPRSRADGDSQLRVSRFPSARVTVSLAPADVRKVGAAFDLPIALGILAASGVLPHREDATLHDRRRAVARRQRPADARAAADCGRRAAIARAVADLPGGQPRSEAGIVEGLPLFPVASLIDAARVLTHRRARRRRRRHRPRPEPADARRSADDLADVRGQLARAARARDRGGRRASPALQRSAGRRQDDAGAAAAGAAAAAVVRRGAGGDDDSLGRRPAAARRRPHARRGRFARRITRARTSRSSAAAAMPRPGELSLAHHGVLFLDELPEFSRRVLETLRQPLEQRVVHIARAARAVTFPGAASCSSAAMNPCPCGYRGSRAADVPLPAGDGRALPAAAVGSAARPVRPRRRPSGGAVVATSATRRPGESTRDGAGAGRRGAPAAARPAGLPERRPRGPALQRTARRPTPAAEALLERGGRPVGLKRSRPWRAYYGSPARSPTSRARPASTRATWQRPCSSGWPIRGVSAEIPVETG